MSLRRLSPWVRSGYSFAMTSAPNLTDPAAPCACGSGLRAGRWCALDWNEPPAPPTPTPEIARAQAALVAGNSVEAEAIVLDLLERFPRHLSALGLLLALRQGESRPAAVEALLTRIVRLDPNNLQATHALAGLLFSKGALAEAEPHARNAVRLAPLDPQSHNLMAMIMTEAQRPQV